VSAITRSLAGQTVILCGISAEFALPIANALALRGAALALVDTDVAIVNAARESLAPITAVQGYHDDAQATTAVQIVANVTTSLGSPSICIVCPPASAFQPASADDLVHTRQIMDAVFMQHAQWCLAVGKHMRSQNRGQIVGITGLAGLGGWRGWSASGAAFGAVENFNRTLAVEWAADGVRINTLVSGVTASLAMVLCAYDPLLSPDRVQKRIPQQRFTSHDDITHALLYLISPANTYAHGETLRVDGGWSSWGRLYAQVK
jgi:NAD(P)-dependent dehydrogenase (short-subunit alcohol dehydrogenase family)